MTERCERALLTLLGDVGPWGRHIYLAGGLAPRYLIQHLPPGIEPHVGTTDVDVIVGLVVPDEDEVYRTLENNLRRSGFEKVDGAGWRWGRRVDGALVIIELLTEEAGREGEGRLTRPRGRTGSISAFKVRGASLAAYDFITVRLEGERLDGGGRSYADLQVVNFLPFCVLKALAYHDRHKRKDAYDLVFCLLHHPDGPDGAGRVASESPGFGAATVEEAIGHMERHFAVTGHSKPATCGRVKTSHLRSEWMVVLG